MSMRFYHRGVRTMIIPSNAGHGQSRVVIGVDEFALNIINSYFQSASIDQVAVGGIFQYIGGGTDWFVFEVSCEDATDPQGTVGAVYRGVYVFGQVFLQMQYVDNEMHFFGPAEWILASGEQIHFNGDNDPNTGVRIHNMSLELSSTGRLVYRGHEVDPGEYIYQTTGLSVSNSTSPQLIPGFEFDVEPGWAYHATALLSVTGASAGGLRVDWSRTGGVVSADIRRFPYGPTPGTTDIQSTAMQTARRDADADAMYGVDGGSVPASVIEEAVIIPSGSGTVGVRAAQAVSDATPTVVSIASRLIVRRGVLMN